MYSLKIILIGLLLLAFTGCTKLNKFSNPVIVQIANLKDRRQTDSLILYLLERNAAYRIESAKALASVQDSSASLQLGTMLLEDPVVEARIAAAFALGQTKGTASVNALIPALEDRESSVLREVLEALGKTVQSADLQNLKGFKAKDTIAQEGLSWAFYQLGLRGLADAYVISKQLEFLKPTYSLQTRLGAAHFFGRAINIAFVNGDELIMAACKDRSPYVRMAATNGLRRLDSIKSIAALQSILESDTDHRVRVSAIRSLSSWSTDRSMEAIVKVLTDANYQVAVAASEAIRPLPRFREAIHQIANSTANTRVQGNLYRVLLEISQNDHLIQQIQALYKSSTNDYQKASLLLSLSGSVKTYQFIAHELLTSTSFVIKSTAAQSLVNCSQSRFFDESLKEKFAMIYQKAIGNGDPGVIGIVAAALADPKSGFKNVIHDFNFLNTAKNKLLLPKDMEALQPLEEAIAYFEGRENPSIKNPFNHPIDWKLINTIRKDQLAEIETTQGKIVLKLLVEEAPGSVANFVDLIKKKYYDNNYFHRVVPNFVIQAGCNRGDGFGSEDYSLRSEFSTIRYKEGSVGMASAGKDTEGTQWFITHSPTPHLDGRYTIFAEVVKGMEVVHAIQLGDKIKSISCVNDCF
jgi:cyclophilin family peptidyl-prolyl cis-trans isomerase/HEAT repeat protein